MSHDNERYQYQQTPNVIDLGLRLEDVQRLGLQSEEQEFLQYKDPTQKFREDEGYDLTKEEMNFLRGTKAGYKYWLGHRVELNAMSNRQFIDLLEKKLREHGVEKVVPDAAVLAKAWQHALYLAEVRKKIAEVKMAPCIALPKKLGIDVRRILKRSPELSWDGALAQIAKKHISKKRSQQSAAAATVVTLPPNEK
jgi:hypothetical protein